jgi:uncharacterized membrane protein (DUF373 family)
VFRRLSVSPKQPGRSHTQVHRALQHYFEWAQDVIAAALAFVLLVVMVQGLWVLAVVAVFEGRDARIVLPQIILVFILVELFRTLLFYLREHRVSVGLMLEVSIVGVLRELLINPPGTSAFDALGIAVLLLVLGVLLIADRLTAPRDTTWSREHAATAEGPS